MCEFCLKHGEGSKWYLQAKNYSEDLLSDLRRRKFLEEFADTEKLLRKLGEVDGLYGRLRRAPWFVRILLRRVVTAKMKKLHFGQVVPIEDVEQILQIVNSVVRVACVCRQSLLGKEKRYCYGMSVGPNGGKLNEIFRQVQENFSGGVADDRFVILSTGEALAAIRAHESEGLCHTVWTFQTPFIGAICNCDRADCLAMHSIFIHDAPTMFRGEYVAEVGSEACSGCRQCMRFCQFGALGYSAGTNKAVVDQKRCYGCGVCRSACRADAIRLIGRELTPVANLW